jgi:hypothetical protein
VLELGKPFPELLDSIAQLRYVSSSTDASPLGVIAIEMMQDNITPKKGHDLVLNLEPWSPEAANFLSICSRGYLDDVHNVSLQLARASSVN